MMPFSELKVTSVSQEDNSLFTSLLNKPSRLTDRTAPKEEVKSLAAKVVKPKPVSSDMMDMVSVSDVSMKDYKNVIDYSEYRDNNRYFDVYTRQKIIRYKDVNIAVPDSIEASHLEDLLYQYNPSNNEIGEFVRWVENRYGYRDYSGSKRRLCSICHSPDCILSH